MAKFLTRFLSARNKTRAHAEAYYVGTHTPFVREYFLTSVPAMLYYAPQRAVGMFVEGDFVEPDAWRWVITERARGTHFAPDPDTQARIHRDHQEFISQMRGFYLRPTVLLDRHDGCVAKYLVEYDKGSAVGDDVHGDAFQSHIGTLGELASSCPALSRLIWNEVKAELATGPLEEPNQRLAEGFLLDTSRLAVEELWFRGAEAGRAFFASDKVQGAMALTDRERVKLYEVVESVLVDRRAAASTT